jgi:TPR repeat protein
MSQYDLGFMLLLGEGTGKDIQEGLWWMEQAASNGGEYAARLLTDIYREGLFGLEPDREKASRWNEKAGALKQEI